MYSETQVKEVLARTNNFLRAFLYLDRCQDAHIRNIDCDYVLRKANKEWLICTMDCDVVKRARRNKEGEISTLLKRYLELYGY